MKRFTLDGKDFDFDPDALFDLTIGEARAIKAHTGLTITAWHYGLVSSYNGDPDVLAGIVWLVRRRSGDEIPWGDIDRINATELLGSVTDVEEPAEGDSQSPEPAVTEAPGGPEKPTGKRNGKPPVKRQAPATETEPAVSA